MSSRWQQTVIQACMSAAHHFFMIREQTLHWEMHDGNAITLADAVYSAVAVLRQGPEMDALEMSCRAQNYH